MQKKSIGSLFRLLYFARNVCLLEKKVYIRGNFEN